MRIALGQLPVSPDPAVNLTRIQAALTDAAAGGAALAVFPEAAQARFGTDLQAVAEPLDGPFGAGLSDAARKSGVALIAGVFEPAPDGRVYNTAVGYDAAGHRVAAYRKIHLFDSLGERESDLVAPGSAPVVIDLAGLRTSGSRTWNLAQAKDAFIRRCEAEAIPFVTMAEVLGLDRTTISHRASPELRERRNAQQRQRSLIKPRRRARTKAAVSAAVFAGAW